ncbi:uncharacterized protein EI97DRAFT_440129 [Westerdykella ornata]|uniref:Uncharacterized protein n=1 Tax=Westerdykella ornata TaxID=318751 RepID=A0A6A6JPJ4_WESOR|nr:uncharacterized protein EI97DRAFT_440129 [Westerdykella ornata]KAF2278570.1 hypothetical protein EI97DRAFT_440129 [Westerdykella ornata]
MPLDWWWQGYGICANLPSSLRNTLTAFQRSSWPRAKESLARHVAKPPTNGFGCLGTGVFESLQGSSGLLDNSQARSSATHLETDHGEDCCLRMRLLVTGRTATGMGGMQAKRTDMKRRKTHDDGWVSSGELEAQESQSDDHTLTSNPPGLPTRTEMSSGFNWTAGYGDRRREE